jgi:hypothetical protein
MEDTGKKRERPKVGEVKKDAGGNARQLELFPEVNKKAY